MKKLILLLIFIGLFQLFLIAQDRDSFKKSMPLTYSAIVQKATKEWPGDYEMIKYTVDKQCVSYIEIRTLKDKYSISGDVYKQVLTGAYDKWCENDWTICFIKYNDIDVIYACMNTDWEMVLYEMKNQFEAYNAMK